MSLWDVLKRLLGFGGPRIPPIAFPPQRPGAPPPAIAPRPAPRAPTVRPSKNPYEGAEEILGLSADEQRKRALKIVPWKTAWIGRVDTIPPLSDERTALIDRGLILRGLLTEEEIAEIHHIGDLWLKHHDAEKLVRAAANETAIQAVEEARKEKAARKEENRRLAAEKKSRRADHVARRRREDIVFLGRGVSRGLADRRALVEKLAERGLPVLASPADLARALEISVPRLRWLAFHSEAAERTHYVYFEVRKRTGGKRLLSSPHEELGKAQRWVLTEILEKLPVEEPAHGFVRGRSTVSNAAPHVGSGIVVNLDLSNFFPTITFPRVRGVFEGLGYSPAVATILALLTTEAPRREVDYLGTRYWVATGDRALPQGACTSPALSNQVAKKLDRRLSGLAKKRGFAYSRYADDLTFSAPRGREAEVAMLLASIRHVVTEEGFALNVKKGRVQRRGGRQTVTGLIVNEKLGVPRENVRRLRAILHRAKTEGLAAQNRENLPHFEAWLKGSIAYVSMVDRVKGARLAADLDALPRG